MYRELNCAGTNETQFAREHSIVCEMQWKLSQNVNFGKPCEVCGATWRDGAQGVGDDVELRLKVVAVRC